MPSSRLIAEPLVVIQSHDVKQPTSSRSRGAFLRPGYAYAFVFEPTEPRGGRSADRRILLSLSRLFGASEPRV
jgi:hypothetical protein